MSYKMDYISDKEVYKAVMYACTLMKPPYNKYYSDAIGIASRTYGVDYSEVQHYVSQRSGRKKGKNTGIKYKYYIVGLFNFTDGHDVGTNIFKNKVAIKKASSKENASKTLETTYKGYVSYKEYGEAHNYLMVFNDMEFKMQKEAEDYLNENLEYVKNWFKGKEYGDW